MSLPASLKDSPLLDVLDTPLSGRGVFASQDILAGTLLLQTDDVVAPVIYREFRKEVCAQCFQYDRGRHWKIRDAACGFSFCSFECRDLWARQLGREGVNLLEIIECLGKSSVKSSAQTEWLDSESPAPDAQKVNDCWQETHERAKAIIAARRDGAHSKKQRNLLQTVLSRPPAKDTLLAAASALICAHSTPLAWSLLMNLTVTPTPYRSVAELEHGAASYLQLLASVPMQLLDEAGASDPFTLASHSAHNAFNIWSLDLNDNDGGPGSECLGYGVWPVASYWNHSCDPNVKKKRSGRAWRFWALRDVRQGEELCISYLGGDEADMDTISRRERLYAYWGFTCNCHACLAVSDEGL